jgi:hypothetical protein
LLIQIKPEIQNHANFLGRKISSFFEKNQCGKPESILSASLMFLHNFAAKTGGT